jgi:hypothetical protein
MALKEEGSNMSRPRNVHTHVEEVWGCKVKDATKPTTIHLTMQHIRDAVPNDPEHCALSLAEKQSMSAIASYTTKSNIYVLFRIKGKLTGLRYMTSTALRRDVINRLDNGKLAEPGLYDLLPPAPSQRFGMAVIRRTALAKLRAEGKAPPTRHYTTPKVKRPYNRIVSAHPLEEN